MTKREKHKLIKSVLIYFQRRQIAAFEAKDERNFDWYSEGEQVFFCLIQDKPIHIVYRVKALK